LAKLTGGVAVIKVGAATEIEMKEKKMRVEDALHATKAAAQEGFVPGGGVALLRASKSLGSLEVEGDEKTGVEILRRAMEEPLRRIAQNAGQEGSLIVGKVRAQKKNVGYNAATRKIEVDPGAPLAGASWGSPPCQRQSTSREWCPAKWDR